MAQTPPRGLTPHFVKTVTRPGTYGDGYGAFGLTFRVRIGARGRVTKSWLQRLPVEAGRRDIGLGSYPAVLLPLARQRALENWQAVKAGVDIHAARRPIPTLAEGFDIVIADLASSWTSDSTEKEWRRHKAYCGPLLATPISDVTKRHVSDVIAAHRTPKNRVPNDLRAKISVVMQWAIDQDYRHDNPAPASITQTIARRRPQSRMKSMPFRHLPDVLDLLQNAEGWWAAKLCLRFLILTVARSEQAREATWEEVDFDHALWTIPAVRMKTRRSEHHVPLSRQAVDSLLDVQEITGATTGPIFPAQLTAEYISAPQLIDLLHSVGTSATPHGIRQCFKNWSSSRTDIAEAVAEKAMAHQPSAAVIRAYLTDDFVEERDPVMQLWADFLSTPQGLFVPAPWERRKR